ncbi:MAG: hypothetical protein ACYTGN_09150 [Planctomycetota bacterium]|jgi:hypothetical protein
MRIFLGALLFVTACGTKQTEFATEGEFMSVMKAEGWVKLGTFADIKWPAHITAEKHGRDEISFLSPEGVSHTYPGYTGYDMRVVRLVGKEGAVAVRVFRSAEKR